MVLKYYKKKPHFKSKIISLSQRTHSTQLVAHAAQRHTPHTPHTPRTGTRVPHLVSGFMPLPYE